ncbi:hypothetical protein FIBSPDRAFT_740020, partial [Athelia psychrophila]
LVSYLWASAVQTFMYALRRNGTFPPQSWPRIPQFLHILHHSSIITFLIMATFIVWALLSCPSTFAITFSRWSMIAQHVMNSLFAPFEILFTDVHPAPWVHAVFLEVFACY